MKKILLFILATIVLSSCGAYKRLGYLQDMDTTSVYSVKPNPQTRIGRGDKIGISVVSSNPMLAAPFNVRPEITVRDSSTVASISDISEYTVDSKGRINFPVIGPIYVEGLTINELSALLVDRITATNYLKDPVVFVSFTNFKVTILGEAGKPATYSFPQGDATIFDLLAQAGDLTQDAAREKLWVIRTTGATRKVYQLNMKSRSVYDSPAFFLQQNDLVIVSPRDTKMDNSVSNVITWVTTPLALISTIFSGWALVRSYKR